MQPQTSFQKLSEMDDDIRSLALFLRAQFDSLDNLLGEVGAEPDVCPPTQSSSDPTAEKEGDKIMLERLISSKNLTSATFPIYGAVKAGKSTFLACLLREKVLPEQALPMTSIPIQVKHVPGCTRRATIPQSEKWNACVAAFKSKLLSRTLAREIATSGKKDGLLFAMQERIRNDELRFVEEYFGEDVRVALDNISHFVRLLWVNNIDYETDHGISIEPDLLPTIEINMRAFQSFGDKSFSLLDTPGPNEAQALEALQKLGPKIMKTSSGCIYCIPWDQVASEQQDQMFTYINKAMAGKQVIVIVTKMDSFMDGSKSIESIRNFIIATFNLAMRDNLTIHFTSGFELFVIYKLQAFLEENKELDDYDLVDKLREAPFAQDLKNQIKIEESFWTRAILCEYVDSGLVRNKNDAVMESFENLYVNAENLALRGHTASLREAHSRWENEFEKLREFATASAERKEEIQKQLKSVMEVYHAVQEQMQNLPHSVKASVERYLKENVADTLPVVTRELNKRWRVVQILPDGTEREVERNEFKGGASDIRMWLRKEGQPKLDSAVRGPTTACLEKVKKELPGIIMNCWEEVPRLLTTLKETCPSERVEDMTMYFSQLPKVEIDIENYVKRTCSFDLNKISFDEEPFCCVIYNSRLGPEISAIFEATFEAISKEIMTFIMADLEVVFANFAILVEREWTSAEKIYKNIEDNLKHKVDLGAMISKVEDIQQQDSAFMAQLEDLEAKCGITRSDGAPSPRPRPPPPIPSNSTPPTAPPQAHSNTAQAPLPVPSDTNAPLPPTPPHSDASVPSKYTNDAITDSSSDPAPISTAGAGINSAFDLEDDPEMFEKVFGMTVSAFKALPKVKRDVLKKQKGYI